MNETNLDQIIKYPQKILSKISQSQSIMGLLVDNPNIDPINSDIDLIGKQLFDYDYIDNTVNDKLSYIMVDTDIDKILNDTIKNVNIIIYIVAHKNIMHLDSKFKDRTGNRRDNLVREVDLLMNGSYDCDGIGKIHLKSIHKLNGLPNWYTGKCMLYAITDFNQNRNLR